MFQFNNSAFIRKKSDLKVVNTEFFMMIYETIIDYSFV